MKLSVLLLFIVVAVSAAVSFKILLFGAGSTPLICDPIVSALASIISRPALIKSKKLFSVVGSALKG